MFKKVIDFCLLASVFFVGFYLYSSKNVTEPPSLEKATAGAESHVTQKDVEARLKENNLQYGVIQLQNGASIVVSQRGGKIYSAHF